MSKKISLFVLIAFSLVIAAYADASTLYVTDQHNIVRYNSDGSDGTTVWSNGYAGISGIADDPLNDDVYYRTEQYPYRNLVRDNDPGTIDPSSGDLDAIQNVTLASNNLFFGNMDYDALDHNVFYIQEQNVYGTTSIQKLNLDTSTYSTIYSADQMQIIGYQGYYNPQPIYAYVHNVEDIVVDPIDNYIYWTDKWAGSISRINFDNTSSGIEELYTGLVNPYGIAIDKGTGNIFWSEIGNSSNNYDSFIKSGNSDGSGSAVTLLSDTDGDSSSYFRDIDVDPEIGRIYFVNHLSEYSSGYGGKVVTMDYNGQNIQDLTNSSDSLILGQLIEISSGANYSTANTVPEPATFAFFIVGGVLIGFGKLINTKKRNSFKS